MKPLFETFWKKTSECPKIFLCDFRADAWVWTCPVRSITHSPPCHAGLVHYSQSFTYAQSGMYTCFSTSSLIKHLCAPLKRPGNHRSNSDASNAEAAPVILPWITAWVNRRAGNSEKWRSADIEKWMPFTNVQMKRLKKKADARKGKRSEQTVIEKIAPVLKGILDDICLFVKTTR